MSALRELVTRRTLLFDGAMGTQIHRRAPAPVDFGGHGNCPEYLNLTRPDLIAAIHNDYLAAGADIVETNSFGANRVTLAEFGLQDRAYELNRKAAEIAFSTAAEHFSPDRPRFVSGSIGPGSKLPSLGQVAFAELEAAYHEQAAGLIDGGADLIQIETCQDPLQIKAALCGAFDALTERRADLPVIVQVTIEQNGRMLLGTELAAIIATCAPYPLFALGLNCGTGPDLMAGSVRLLAERSPFAISILPNAGLPELVDGNLHYPLGPDGFAAQVTRFVADHGVELVGGCCGTTPAHIAALRNSLDALEKRPARRSAMVPAFSSLYAAQEMDAEPSPLIIGERPNASGSKEFREALMQDDLDRMTAVAQEQEREGAHLIDLNVAVAGRDEPRDMAMLAAKLATLVRLPLSLDTTNPDALEAALRTIGGRPLINSVNLEDDARADRIVRLARRYGAALIALTIDGAGMARTRDRKLAVAKDLAAFAEKRGLSRGDIFIDTLTFTLGSGDPDLRGAAVETLEAIKLIKKELPGVRTLLGVSNISYGLKPTARRILNAVFLYHAVQAGLDAAIFHAGKVIPVAQIPEADLRLAERLIFNDRAAGDPLEAFIARFEKEPPKGAAAPRDDRPVEEKLIAAVIEGRKSDIAPLIMAALDRFTAAEILDRFLLAGMKEVGAAFGAGKMQLPFVLKAAETMRAAVELLKPHFAGDAAASRGTAVIATVKGDIHDIGKNLVDIILSNNGWQVHNLGTDRSAAEIIAAATKHRPDFVGLSGLLVRSAIEMKEVVRGLADAGLAIPVICGGAALNRRYIDAELAPLHGGRVHFAQDAFEAMRLMENAGDRPVTPVEAARPHRFRHPHLSFDHAVPTVPFTGRRVVRDIALADLAPLMNKKRLFRIRWQMEDTAAAEKTLARLLATADTERLFSPAAVYGHFACRPDGDRLILGDTALTFPRTLKEPRRALPDYFRPSGDIAPLFAVTVGPAASAKEKDLFGRNEYVDYFLLHGLSVELAEALAEWMHRRIAAELGLDVGRGKRFSPGFSSWDDLAEQRRIFELLHPEEIGLSLTGLNELVPEQSVTALFVHHPQVEYF
ncbi:MAG TPA: homocysteine S-methyltransferase family protein [bacterium]|nr:homocysteine S-methyltransferase family protein [bacterium]